MLSELHSLNLKLCSQQYNKNCFEPDCGTTAKQWTATKLLSQNKAGGRRGDITTQPKQGRRSGPISSLCILLSMIVTQYYPCPNFSFFFKGKSFSKQRIFIDFILGVGWFLQNSDRGASRLFQRLECRVPKQHWLRRNSFLFLVRLRVRVACVNNCLSNWWW